MVEMLNQHLTHNTYSDTQDPAIFANVLSKELFDINHDKHLKVIFAPTGIEKWLENQHTNNDNQSLNTIATDSNDNFGFKETKILDGNILSSCSSCMIISQVHTTYVLFLPIMCLL